MERSYGEWKEGRLQEMGLGTICLVLIMTWGLDLKNRSGVRDLVPTPHREDAGI